MSPCIVRPSYSPSSPRPPGRGRIEVCDGGRGSGRCGALHGLRVVAALKRSRRSVRSCKVCGSPRPPGRGRIEASSSSGRRIVVSSPRPPGRGRIEAVSTDDRLSRVCRLLHGLRVVAALKLCRSSSGPSLRTSALHGLRVVAALKLGTRAWPADTWPALHGLRVVAALKRAMASNRRRRGALHGLRVVAALKSARPAPPSPTSFSTASGSWPH